MRICFLKCNENHSVNQCLLRMDFVPAVFFSKIHLPTEGKVYTTYRYMSNEKVHKIQFECILC